MVMQSLYPLSRTDRVFLSLFLISRDGVKFHFFVVFLKMTISDENSQKLSSLNPLCSSQKYICYINMFTNFKISPADILNINKCILFENKITTCTYFLPSTRVVHRCVYATQENINLQKDNTR